MFKEFLRVFTVNPLEAEAQACLVVSGFVGGRHQTVCVRLDGLVQRVLLQWHQFVIVVDALRQVYATNNH